MDNKITKNIHFYTIKLMDLYTAAKNDPKYIFPINKLIPMNEFKIDNKIFCVEIIDSNDDHVFGILSIKDADQPIDLRIRQANNDTRNILNENEQLEKFTFFYINKMEDGSFNIAALSSKVIQQFDKCFEKYLSTCKINEFEIYPEIIEDAENEIKNITDYVSSSLEFDTKGSNELMNNLFDLSDISNNNFIKKLQISFNFEKNKNPGMYIKKIISIMKPSKNAITIKNGDYEFIVDAITNTLTRKKRVEIDRVHFYNKKKYPEIKNEFTIAFKS